MRLLDLKPRPGAKHRRKRLGQGESSGHGKTAGRGGKGQTARSGSSIRIGFEGGQMPLIRRIPKRGFNNARHTIRYLPVNLEALNKFEDGARVDEAALRTAGLANGRVERIKILGDGELTRKLTVSAHAAFFSKQAGGGSGLLSMYSMFTGGALEHCAVGALGIMPYISATIIIQLLTAVVPTLSKLAREEGGRTKIIQYGRYLTVLLCLGQGLFMAIQWEYPERIFGAGIGKLVLYDPSHI